LLRKAPTQARLYITALGLYRCRINGRDVTDSMFNPGWTGYERLLQYQTFDVTGLLREGANVITAVLADGWYAGCIGLFGREYYSGTTSFCCQLESTSDDGASAVVSSDSQWKYVYGPFLSSDLILGERYDATREIEGWELPDFHYGDWSAAREYHYTTAPLLGDLVAQSGPLVRVNMTLAPAAISQPLPGTFIFDMGQNMVGRTRLRISGTPPTNNPSRSTVFDTSRRRVWDTPRCRAISPAAWCVTISRTPAASSAACRR
jgi:alpha-L-rhamnosidase